MNIVILSRNRKLCSTNRLIEAGKDVASMNSAFIKKNAKPGRTQTRGRG